MEALKDLVSNPWLYLILLALIGAGRILVKRFVESAVDHRFALRLESHKHDLALTAEVERFHLQRKLAGVGLYLEKQHSAAAEIYAAIRVAHGAVGGLFGAQRGWSFEDCNEADLREIFDQYEILHGKQEDLVNQWRLNRSSGSDTITKYLRDIAVPLAEKKLQEARNLMYVNEIYFSDETIQAFDKFVAECNVWIARRYFPPQRGETIEPVSRDRLNGAMDAVQIAVRAELTQVQRASLPSSAEGISKLAAPPENASGPSDDGAV